MIKISFNELKNNIYINSLICIQFVIVLVLSIAVSSIIAYHYRYYNCFKDYFEADGYLYRVEKVYINDDYYLASNTDEIEELLTGAEVIGCYDIWANYYDEAGNQIELNAIGYDDEIINSYVPELESGVWLDDDMGDGSYIEAVISCNNDNIQVGDTILLNNLYYDNIEQSFKVKIVGRLEDGAKIIGFSENTYIGRGDYSDIYCDYYLEDEEVPVLLLNA